MSYLSEKFGLFDDGRQYVIIANMNSLISPIRHIIELKDDSNHDEIERDYYEIYHKLVGDEFIYCNGTKRMREKEAFLVKKHDLSFKLKDKKAEWEKLKKNNFGKVDDNA